MKSCTLLNWQKKFLAGSVLLLAAVPTAATFAAGLELVSTTPSDYSGAGQTGPARLSDDGRYILFSSTAGDLAPNDTNGYSDVFLRDRLTGTTTLLGAIGGSTTSSSVGSGFDEDSLHIPLSADGRYAVFNSQSTDLVGNDFNAKVDGFLRDVQQQATTLLTTANVDPLGLIQVAGGGTDVQITPDGHFAAFVGYGAPVTSNDDQTGIPDVFVYDRTAGTTTLVSVNQSGINGNDTSLAPRITPDGHYILFRSKATDLVTIPTTAGRDNMFVRDRQTNTTTLVTVNVSGDGDANATSFRHDITPDGRYVVFASDASNIVTNDHDAPNPGTGDVFVRDLQLGITTLVSVNASGTDSGNGTSGFFWDPMITPNGRYVVFESYADDLVTNDVNGRSDVFIRDLQASTTTLVSVNMAGTASGNGDSAGPQVSADGRFVVFHSWASDLAPNDTNGQGINTGFDVFLRDMKLGKTYLLSKNMAGTASGNDSSVEPRITPDGRSLVFTSGASDLVPNDNNNNYDVFFLDLTPYHVPVLTGVVSRKTHGSAGTFDVDLPFIGTRGIECRSGGVNGDYTLVFTFADPLTKVGSASVSSGTGTVHDGAIDSGDAHQYIVNLTGVANAQIINVRLTNVGDSAGNFSTAVDAPMGVLLGDVNASLRVDSGDVSLVRQQTLQTVTTSNFREDINASGRIDSGDVSIARQQTLTSLP